MDTHYVMYRELDDKENDNKSRLKTKKVLIVWKGIRRIEQRKEVQ